MTLSLIKKQTSDLEKLTIKLHVKSLWDELQLNFIMFTKLLKANHEIKFLWRRVQFPFWLIIFQAILRNLGQVLIFKESWAFLIWLFGFHYDVFWKRFHHYFQFVKNISFVFHSLNPHTYHGETVPQRPKKVFFRNSKRGLLTWCCEFQ